jgi:adenylate cyclase
MKNGGMQLGFKSSIIALFVAIVLIIGLTLVYLSFQRITAITDSAASQFIGKVAELSADRIGSQLKLVRDNLEILNALPPIQSAEIEDNPRLIALLAAMLKNNDQLFSLYVGYDDGSFIEMDAIDGAGRETRARLEAHEQAAFRLFVISRSDPAAVKSRRLFLSDRLETIRELPRGAPRRAQQELRNFDPGQLCAQAACRRSILLPQRRPDQPQGIRRDVRYFRTAKRKRLG